MHLGEQMELGSSKSQMPLSNNRKPTRKKKKMWVLVSVFLCLAVKMEESIGKTGKAARELRADELTARETNCSLS